MTPVTDPNAAHQETTIAFMRLRELYDTEQYSFIVDWLNAVAAEQQAQMIECNKDRLIEAQVRLKQLVALRDSLVSKSPQGTGFIV